jgi:hypothetical protein
MKPISEYTRETWNRYKAYYTIGLIPYQEIKTPNKIYARLDFGGELRAGLKIIKIKKATLMQTNKDEKHSVIYTIKDAIKTPKPPSGAKSHENKSEGVKEL